MSPGCQRSSFGNIKFHTCKKAALATRVAFLASMASKLKNMENRQSTTAKEPKNAKKCKFLLSITLWPLIWPLRPSSAFFNFFEILDTYEVQWYAKMFYLSSITSRTISE